MIDILVRAGACFGVVALVALIVWEVYRHWDDIVRLSRAADVEPVQFVDWRIAELPRDEARP